MTHSAYTQVSGVVRTLVLVVLTATPFAQGCKKSSSSSQNFGPLGGGAGDCNSSGAKFGTLGSCGTSGQATITFAQWFTELQNSDYDEAGQRLLKDYLDDLAADATDDAKVTLLDNSREDLDDTVTYTVEQSKSAINEARSAIEQRVRDAGKDPATINLKDFWDLSGINPRDLSDADTLKNYFKAVANAQPIIDGYNDGYDVDDDSATPSPSTGLALNPNFTRRGPKVDLREQRILANAYHKVRYTVEQVRSFDKHWKSHCEALDVAVAACQHLGSFSSHITSGKPGLVQANLGSRPLTSPIGQGPGLLRRVNVGAAAGACEVYYKNAALLGCGPTGGPR